MKKSGKVGSGLVAMGSAAVLAVYAAGYARTDSAAKPVPRPKRAVVAMALPVVPAVPAPVARKEAAPVKVPKVAPQLPDPLPPDPELAVVEKPADPPPPPPPPPPPVTVWKDGAYTGWGTSRHGDIQASVVIEGGKIASATIAQCLTRYKCDVIDKLPPQVAQRQSPDVDFVSGATQSADAFYYAVVDALSKAK
jgi:hypothetical protein